MAYLPWLSLVGLALCIFAASCSYRERRRLERLLQQEPLIYVYFHEPDEHAYPMDVTSKQADLLRQNAPWN